MGEIKPGILALVVGCKSNPEDIGKIVKVEKQARMGDLSPNGEGVFGEHTGWLCTSENISSWPYGEAGWCYYDSAHLLPINPEADPLEQTQQQEQAA